MSTRRRIVMRAGLVAMALATACALAACIFEQSDYKGGGRIGHAVTAQQGTTDGTATAPPEDTTPPSSTSTAPPIPDAGLPGS